MIKNIIVKANDLLMRNAVRVFSKSKDKWIFEVFDESDNCKYTPIFQRKGNYWEWVCDCMSSTLHPTSHCIHKISANKLMEIEIYKLR